MSAAVQIGRPFNVLCNVDDDRDQWLEFRHSGIGASEIASVLGESPFASAIELYANKIGKYERDLSGVESVYWGNKLEAPIIEAYSERTGRKTRKAGQLLQSVEHPWALCTLDGETWHGAANDAWPLEIKNVGGFKAEEWVNGAPPHYFLQCQQQMLVTGAAKATIAALIGGQKMVWADIPRDDTTIRKIIYHGSRFWERIQARDVPMPDGTEGAKRALAALYPEGCGIVVLPGTAIDAADELESLKAERKAINDKIDIIENTVRAALGDCETGAMTDGRSFSWKVQKRAEFVTAASTFRVLRLHQPKNKK
ncbi:MAG TPA: YqaJ viral recombinase family protein [Polyangiaceae bacterium]|jgi:putative phage-type endonuclease